MHDHSTRIFNYVRDRVQEAHPDCFCTTSYLSATEAKLPALYMSFTFPSEDESTRDSSCREIWTRTLCDAEAYSGQSAQEARAILATADDAMSDCGFRRTAYSEIPNAADPSVRRFTITWRAKLDESGNAAPW